MAQIIAACNGCCHR